MVGDWGEHLCWVLQQLVRLWTGQGIENQYPNPQISQNPHSVPRTALAGSHCAWLPSSVCELISQQLLLISFPAPGFVVLITPLCWESSSVTALFTLYIGCNCIMGAHGSTASCAPVTALHRYCVLLLSAGVYWCSQ